MAIRSSASQLMVTDRRSGATRTVITLGVIIASFGAAAFGVLLAASSFAS
jgi:hypothetical protein